MNNPAILVIVAILLMPLLAGCPSQSGDTAGSSVAVEDSHAGHDHAQPAAAAPAEEEDAHAGHDHAAEESADHEEVVDEHAGHDHAAEEEVAGISLSAEQIIELDITTVPAGPGTLGRELELNGEIAINEDAVTHVVPLTAGIVRRVNYRLGDHVTAGAAMVELDSMELAALKSGYLAMLSQLELLRENLERERMLVDKGISAEQDYLAARQAHEEKLIEKRGLEEELKAYGITEALLAELAENSAASLTTFIVYAPAAGEILEKHVALGEMVDTSTALFTIGNLSTVWARLNVYQEDMADITEGLDVLIDAGHGIESVWGRIDYIEPIIGESTRTAVARVVLPRSSKMLRPGLFVTGHVEIGDEMAGLVVPRNAVIELDDDRMIFVRRGTVFEPRVVSIGRETASDIEVLSGLEPNEDVVVTGAFQLKAELLKGTFDPHAGHAH